MTEYLGPKTSGTNIATQSDLGGAGATSMPTGIILPYASSASAPTGFLVCDGSNINRTTYSELFAIIGTIYGVGDGSTTFALPNLKGRAIVGYDAGQSEFDSVGETGGNKTVALSSAEIPSHNHDDGTLTTNETGGHDHTLSGVGHAHNYDRSTISVNTGSNFVRTGGGSAVTSVSLTNTSTGTSTETPTVKMGTAGAHYHSIGGYTGNTGGGGAHNNLQPYIALFYIIKT